MFDRKNFIAFTTPEGMREPKRFILDRCFQIELIAMAIPSSHHLAITNPTGNEMKTSAVDRDIASHQPEHGLNVLLKSVRSQSVLGERVT